MTRRESAIISAYTGIMCGPFDAMHEYIEEIMGRSVWTHELANEEIVKQIQQLSKPDFIKLAESVK